MICYTYKGFDSYEEAKKYALWLASTLVMVKRTDPKDNHGIEKAWTVRSEKLTWDKRKDEERYNQTAIGDNVSLFDAVNESQEEIRYE